MSLEWIDFVSRKAHWVVVQSYARDDGVVPYVEITDLTGCMWCRYKVKYLSETLQIKWQLSIEGNNSDKLFSWLLIQCSSTMDYLILVKTITKSDDHFQIISNLPQNNKNLVWLRCSPWWSRARQRRAARIIWTKSVLPYVSHLFLTPQLSSPLLNYTAR